MVGQKLEIVDEREVEFILKPQRISADGGETTKDRAQLNWTLWIRDGQVKGFWYSEPTSSQPGLTCSYPNLW